MSIPLASGLGDWGFLGGPLIYVVIAFYMLLLWRVAQMSPRLFLAILVAGGGVNELFWDDTFYSIRAFAFGLAPAEAAGPNPNATLGPPRRPGITFGKRVGSGNVTARAFQPWH